MPITLVVYAYYYTCRCWCCFFTHTYALLNRCTCRCWCLSAWRRLAMCQRPRRSTRCCCKTTQKKHLIFSVNLNGKLENWKIWIFEIWKIERFEYLIGYSLIKLKKNLNKNYCFLCVHCFVSPFVWIYISPLWISISPFVNFTFYAISSALGHLGSIESLEETYEEAIHAYPGDTRLGDCFNFENL